MKITTKFFRDCKSKGEKILMLTAYDACTAAWAEAAGVPTILVGDSMGNTVLGYPNTLPVTLEESLAHTAAVRRGAPDAFVIGDMPFLSYQISVEEAVRNAGRYLKECGADAVKLEGGRAMLPVIERLVTVGIPVVGHIGLLPQSVLKDGGYRLHGKADAEAREILEDAKALEAAGVCAMVLEGIPGQLAAEITSAVSTATIGIGAGNATDGQVQVLADLLGLAPGGFTPKHAKRYAELGEAAVEAIRQYVSEVQGGVFPPAKP